MGAFQPIHLIILLVIVVILFGGAKIPELMRGVGKGMGEFRKGIDEGKQPDAPSDKEADANELQRIQDRRAALEAEKAKLAAEEEELKRLKG